MAKNHQHDGIPAIVAVSKTGVSNTPAPRMDLDMVVVVGQVAAVAMRANTSVAYPTPPTRLPNRAPCHRFE